jgi:hypothetical protein
MKLSRNERTDFFFSDKIILQGEELEESLEVGANAAF